MYHNGPIGQYMCTLADEYTRVTMLATTCSIHYAGMCMRPLVCEQASHVKVSGSDPATTLLARTYNTMLAIFHCRSHPAATYVLAEVNVTYVMS